MMLNPTILRLRCKCGWQGSSAELHIGALSYEMQCPECAAPFTAWPRQDFIHEGLMTNTPVALITSHPDHEIAKDIKAEILAKLEEVCLVADKATAAGFQVQFGIGQRWDGKWIATQLTIAKHF
jgi:hypothetical protein